MFQEPHNNKTELLAPAGDIEAAYAAFFYGADAVYLGLQQFSARASAVNFDEKSLDELTAYAHHLGKKVFVAVNTLLQQSELPDLLKTLDICSNCRVDAIIVQDLGVAGVIKKAYPELVLHASTQMAVHNVEGAVALQKFGFKRVVLARELSLAEIKPIAAVKGLETEVFIHGALCYSYSGLCLFSSIETARSANRGKCQYPCRSCFAKDGQNLHLFSMKDLALEDEVLKLNVTSLKIEGRKKTALYVAAVTNYYRHILDGGKPDKKSAEDIKQIFSRPWTKLHFSGKNKDVIDRNFVGHRGLKIGKIATIDGRKIGFVTKHKLMRFDGLQIDVAGLEKPFGFAVKDLKVAGKNVFEAAPNAAVEVFMPVKNDKIKVGQDVYLSSSSAVKGGYAYAKPKPEEFKNRAQIEVTIRVLPHKIEAFAAGQTAVAEGRFEPAEKKSDAVEKAFNKIGEVNFVPLLQIDNRQNLFTPASVLNNLRRELYAKIVLDGKHGTLPKTAPALAHQTPKWIVKTDNVTNLAQLDLSEIDEILCLLTPNFVPASLSNLPQEKVRIALPPVCRNLPIFAPTVETLLKAGYQKWEIANPWGLEFLPAGLDISFDGFFSMLNLQSIETAKELGASRVCLSVEDSKDNYLTLAQNAQLPTVFIAYQDIPLFISANCIRENACKNCSQKTERQNLSLGKEQFVSVSQNCQNAVYKREPLCLGQEWQQIGASYVRLDFCGMEYAPAAAAEIFAAVKNGHDVKICHKGNFYKSI